MECVLPNTNFDRERRLDKRRIARLVVQIVVIVLLFISLPLIPAMRKALVDYEFQLADRAVQKDVAKYALGLSPCGYSPGAEDRSDVDHWLQSYLPARSNLSVNAWPALSPSPSAVRLVGQDLFYFEWNFSLYDKEGPPPGRFNPRGIPKIFHSRLSSEIARRLSERLHDDINHAQAKMPEGLDGTTYYFQWSKFGCAATWSPESGTHAGQDVELFNLLARHAKSDDAREREVSERSIQTILNSMP